MPGPVLSRLADCPASMRKMNQPIGHQVRNLRPKLVEQGSKQTDSCSLRCIAGELEKERSCELSQRLVDSALGILNKMFHQSGLSSPWPSLQPKDSVASIQPVQKFWMFEKPGAGPLSGRTNTVAPIINIKRQ